MRLSKLALFIILLCFQNKGVLGQTNPLTDLNWVLNPSLSDEFNSFILNSKWAKLGAGGAAGSPSASFDPNYVGFDGNNLLLKTDRSGSNYITSGIQSNAFASLHGYFEVEALLPYGKGFWPTFWIWGADGDNAYTEFDILEPAGCQYQYADRNVYGFWYKPLEHVPCSAAVGSPDYMEGCDVKVEFDKSGISNMSQNWHKYGLEWHPGIAIFYLDNVPIGVAYNDSRVPSNACRVMIDLQISDNDCAPTASVVFPQYMKINYYRYYTLKKSCSDVKVVVGNDFDFLNSSNFSLFKSFTVSNTTIPANSNVTVRATDFIDMDAGFDVPAGTGFTAIVMPCY
jgi:beta-glucanase (GH16 family)